MRLLESFRKINFKERFVLHNIIGKVDDCSLQQGQY